MIRLFVGIAIPPTIEQRLAMLDMGIPGARRVEARNLHVTLRFIGEVEEHVAAEIDEALEAVSSPAFEMAVNGFGTFGSKQPRALWAGVEKVPELMRLQTKVDSVVTRCGLEPEPRKFTPHITLAWLKGASISRLQAFIAGSSPFHAGPAPVENFILYRSHLGRSGAEYEVLAEYPLG